MIKKNQLIIPLLIVCFNLKAQSFDKVIDLLSTCKTIKDFKSKVPNYREKTDEIDTFYYNSFLGREVGFGYKEYKNSFIANDNKGNEHFYDVTFLTRNDSIMLCYIKEESDRIITLKKLSEKTLIIDNQGINDYLSKRNNVFNTQMTPKKLVSDLHKDYTLEFFCGEVGGNYSKEANQMRRYVANKNKTQLNNWLKSANSELQVYGAKGLLLLQKKSTLLMKGEKNIIQFLKKQNAQVKTCSGCLYGMASTFSKEIEGLE